MPCPVEIRLVPPGEPEPAVEPPGFVAQTRSGVRIEYRLGSLSGGDLLHLAVAGCVFNGLVRVARERGIALTRALVAAEGGFNEEGTRSTGIDYRIELSGAASDDDLRALAAFVQDDASVPSIVRHGAPVSAVEVTVDSRSA